jgi:hypothetical protein
MTYAIDTSHLPAQTYTQPSDIQTLPAYVVRGKISRNGEVVPSPGTDIYPSWYKPKTGATNQAVTIDRVSNKIATACTPASAKQTLGGNAAPNTFSIDQFYPPGQTGSTSSANTGATDDVHHCGDNPPTISLTANDNGDGTYQIVAFATAGTHPFNDSAHPQFPGTITYSINGQTVHTTNNIADPNFNDSWTYTPTASGTMTATVTDSVLYSASDSKPINFTPQAQGISDLQATATGGHTTISWNGGSSPFTVSDNASGQLNSCTASGCKVDLSDAPVGSTVTVKDSSGNSDSVVVH